jgi:hypothetical protein
MIRQTPINGDFRCAAKVNAYMNKGTATALLLHLGEKLLEAALGLAQTFVSEHHGLLLPDRVADQSSFMEPTHGFPINALPRADSIVKREIKNGKDRFVDLCGVDVHDQLRDLSGPPR